MWAGIKSIVRKYKVRKYTVIRSKECPQVLVLFILSSSPLFCHSGEVNHCWKFGQYFAGKTTVDDDKFIGGFLRKANLNKSAETHEFWIFKADGRTCFKWRTRQDHAHISEGTRAKDFWHTPEQFPNGVPVFKPNVDWKEPPELGGYNPNWKQPANDSVEFLRTNNNFSNDSPWMEYFNPEWKQCDPSAHTAADELQKYWNAAPRTEQQFLELNKDKQYGLPRKWHEMDSSGNKYRGWRVEEPSSASSSVAQSKGTGWRDPGWNRACISQVRLPETEAADGTRHAAVTDASIRAAEKAQKTAVEDKERTAAEHRSDEPVLVGSLVYLVQHKQDVRPGFTQPLLLALVTDIKYKENKEEQVGSVDPEDLLEVQYCTASAYDKQYRPAWITDADARKQQLPKGSIMCGSASRFEVAIANVVTAMNKEGSGQSAVATLINPFVCYSRCKFKIDGYTTKQLLKTHPLAGFDGHSGTHATKKRKAVAASCSSRPSPLRTQARQRRKMTDNDEQDSDDDYSDHSLGNAAGDSDDDRVEDGVEDGDDDDKSSNSAGMYSRGEGKGEARARKKGTKKALRCYNKFLDDSDDHDDEDTACSKCSGTHSRNNNPMLLCDKPECGAGWHIKCLPQALSAVPPGSWFCSDCTSKGSKGSNQM